MVGTPDEESGLSVTTDWVLISIVLHLVALALSVALVVPSPDRAAGELTAGRTERARARNGRIAAARASSRCC